MEALWVEQTIGELDLVDRSEGPLRQDVQHFFVSNESIHAAFPRVRFEIVNRLCKTHVRLHRKLKTSWKGISIEPPHQISCIMGQARVLIHIFAIRLL